jgi:hypothetical protein
MEMLHGLQAGKFEATIAAFANLVDHADWPDVLRLIEMTGGESHCDYWAIWPNGERRRISLAARRHDEEGGVSRVLGVSVDITARELELHEAARIASVRARGESVADAASRLARVLDRDLATSVSLLNEIRTNEQLDDLAPLVDDAIAGLNRAMSHAESFEQVARIHSQGAKPRN